LYQYYIRPYIAIQNILVHGIQLASLAPIYQLLHVCSLVNNDCTNIQSCIGNDGGDSGTGGNSNSLAAFEVTKFNEIFSGRQLRQDMEVF